MFSSLIHPVDKLTSPWEFVASQPNTMLRWHRAKCRWFRRIAPPACAIVKPLSQRGLWFVYFVFSPLGLLSPAHRFTLSRLRDMGAGVFVVFASSDVSNVPADAIDLADALYWKSLDGYDFSAYAIAIRAVAEHSPHATVFVMNDSVLGPLSDLRPFSEQSPWDMLGFTASSLHENHVQSYAFVVRDVSRKRAAALAAVLPADYAYSAGDDVIKCQELCLARVASNHMSVGACWYGVFEDLPDPTLSRPVELIGAGFPFMKRSVFGGKHHLKFQPRAQDALRYILVNAKHPV